MRQCFIEKKIKNDRSGHESYKLSDAIFELESHMFNINDHDKQTQILNQIVFGFWKIWKLRWQVIFLSTVLTLSIWHNVLAPYTEIVLDYLDAGALQMKLSISGKVIFFVTNSPKVVIIKKLNCIWILWAFLHAAFLKEFGCKHARASG